jgi:hypothetical protein
MFESTSSDTYWPFYHNLRVFLSRFWVKFSLYIIRIKFCDLWAWATLDFIHGGRDGDTTILEKLDSYIQTEEKEGSGFNENWAPAETSAHAISALFS